MDTKVQVIILVLAVCTAIVEIVRISKPNELVCVASATVFVEPTEHGKVVRCVDIRGEVVK